MVNESDSPERAINIQVTPNSASEADVSELIEGIKVGVGQAVQTWQERMKEREAARSAVPQATVGG